VKKIVAVACIAVFVAGFAGCARQGIRIDENVEGVATHDFNPKDLQIIGKKAVKQLLERSDVNEVLGSRAGAEGKRPALYVARIRNRTDEHVNSEAISEYIAVEMDLTGKIQLVEYNKAKEEAVAQLEFQQGAFVDPTTAKQVGKMVGADFFLQGELTNISVRAGGKKGQYFLFTLTLVDIETIRSWKSRVEVQKISKRGWFGW